MLMFAFYKTAATTMGTITNACSVETLEWGAESKRMVDRGFTWWQLCGTRGGVGRSLVLDFIGELPVIEPIGKRTGWFQEAVNPRTLAIS